MITHYIIMSSSYSLGKRIAMDNLVSSDKKNYDELKKILEEIIEKCGTDVSLSTHFVQTDSKSWKSVTDKDYFFKNVEVIGSKEKFIELIQKDRILKGVDVAKYILSKVKCTHLKLEKLVYLCYAEYLCQYDKPLYDDVILAYKLGPVVSSVYEKYKKYGYGMIENEDIDMASTLEMPSKSRILFAENGIEKIESIDRTLKKYAHLTASDLVDLTHRENTPWFLTEKNDNEVIEDEAIKKYHCNEII